MIWIARACGDLKAALHWTLVMSCQVKIARKVNDLARTHAQPRRKPPKPAPPPPVKLAPKLPVMLDPEGFSPGGTPNRYLNLQRLVRPGISDTTGAEL